MKRVFFYYFVLLSLFAKQLNQRNKYFIYSGWAYMSAFIQLNLLAIIFAWNLQRPKIIPLGYPIACGLIAAGICHVILLPKKRESSVFEKYFDELQRSKNRAIITGSLIAYVLASLLLVIYLGNVGRIALKG